MLIYVSWKQHVSDKQATYTSPMFLSSRVKAVGALRNGAVLLFLQLIMLIVRSFVCRQRVVVGHWREWPVNSAGRSVAGQPISQGSNMFPPSEQLHTHVIFLQKAGAYSWRP